MRRQENYDSAGLLGVRNMSQHGQRAGQRVGHAPLAVALVEQRAVRVGRGGIRRVMGDHHDRVHLHPIRVQVHQVIMSGDGDR